MTSKNLIIALAVAVMILIESQAGALPDPPPFLGLGEGDYNVTLYTCPFQGGSTCVGTVHIGPIYWDFYYGFLSYYPSVAWVFSFSTPIPLTFDSPSTHYNPPGDNEATDPEGDYVFKLHTDVIPHWDLYAWNPSYVSYGSGGWVAQLIIPEPSSLILVGFGLIGLAAWARRMTN